VEAVYSSEAGVQVCVEGLSGGDVFDHLFEQERLTEAEAAAVLAQLLDALEYMHGQNIAHRDIKPENLVYVAADRKHVKLIDFGFAKAWDGETPMRRTCGTDGYRAPEVMKGSYTMKADLWSVGVLAHVLLTEDLIGRHSNWAPRFSERFGDLSPEAQAFIQILLQRNHARRPSAAQMRKHPWLLQHQARANVDCPPRPLMDSFQETLDVGMALDTVSPASSCSTMEPQKVSTTSWLKKQAQLLKVPIKMPGAFKATFGKKPSRVFVTTQIVPDGSGCSDNGKPTVQVEPKHHCSTSCWRPACLMSFRRSLLRQLFHREPARGGLRFASSSFAASDRRPLRQRPQGLCQNGPGGYHSEIPSEKRREVATAKSLGLQPECLGGGSRCCNPSRAAARMTGVPGGHSLGLLFSVCTQTHAHAACSI